MNLSGATRSPSTASRWLQLAGIFCCIVPAQVSLADNGYAQAQVIAVSPRYETVTYSEPREECRMERVAYSHGSNKSSTPKLIGALIGGALGNALGAKRPNKQVGAVVGGVLGYSIGKDIARHNSHHRGEVRYRQEEVCEVFYDQRQEQQLSGYDVTYEYGGKSYQALLDEHPGATIRVKVRVRPA